MSQHQTTDSSTEKPLSSIDLCVRNPKTHNTWDQGRYTSYEIAIKTTNQSFCLGCSFTRRRYSDFEWLKKKLKQHHPRTKLPKLPPKRYFGDRFDPSFIAYRMKGLENFLNELVMEKMCMSDVLLHLFLQSNLENSEMNEVMEGRIPSEVIDRLWKNGGDKTKCREFQKEESASEDAKEKEEVDSENSEESFTDSGSSITEDESSGGEVTFPPISMVTDAMEISKGESMFAKSLVGQSKDSGVSSSDEAWCSDNVQSAAELRRCHDNSTQAIESQESDVKRTSVFPTNQQKCIKSNSKQTLENDTKTSNEAGEEIENDSLFKGVQTVQQDAINQNLTDSENVGSSDISSSSDTSYQKNCFQNPVDGGVRSNSDGIAGVVEEVKYSINNDSSDHGWVQ